MQRYLLIFACVAVVAACGKVGDLVELMEVSNTVETELENLHGLKSRVTFNKVNGTLKTVGVVFDQEEVGDLTVAEIVVLVEPSIRRHFKETPEVLSVSVVVRQ